jgi:hypothetical protein
MISNIMPLVIRCPPRTVIFALLWSPAASAASLHHSITYLFIHYLLQLSWYEL